MHIPPHGWIACAVSALFGGFGRRAGPSVHRRGYRHISGQDLSIWRDRFRLALVVAVAVAPYGFNASPGAAHNIPTNTIINAFVKIEPKQADLVVRIPIDLLRGLPFPKHGSEYDLAASEPVTELALQALADGFVFMENGVRLVPAKASGRLSPNSDRSFEDYKSAVAHTDNRADPTTQILYDQSEFDLHFTYPISSPRSEFRIQSQVAADLGNATKLLVRYLPLGENSRAMIIEGGSEPKPLNPTWYDAAGSFVGLGIEHILSGIDHLLFLFCLVIPFRRVRGLFSVITAFTLAHSVTLFASAFHLAPRGAWFPPFVETAIAASIVYMALENVVGPDLRRRWLITGMFGLVHGFGFADVLTEQLQFAGSYLLVSLFSFNVGIELGQMVVLGLMLPALALCRRLVPERKLIIILSAVAAFIAGNWMVERYAVLREHQWPGLDDLLNLARWPALLLIMVGIASLVVRWVRRKIDRGADVRRWRRALDSARAGIGFAQKIVTIVSGPLIISRRKSDPIIAVGDASLEQVDHRKNRLGC